VGSGDSKAHAHLLAAYFLACNVDARLVTGTALSGARPLRGPRPVLPHIFSDSSVLNRCSLFVPIKPDGIQNLFYLVPLDVQNFKQSRTDSPRGAVMDQRTYQERWLPCAWQTLHWLVSRSACPHTRSSAHTSSLVSITSTVRTYAYLNML
jgi:hypothetical protein